MCRCWPTCSESTGPTDGSMSLTYTRAAGAVQRSRGAVQALVLQNVAGGAQGTEARCKGCAYAPVIILGCWQARYRATGQFAVALHEGYM